MAEPSSSVGVTLTMAVVGMLGPLAGPYAVIVFAALAGAMWPLSAVRTDPCEGAWLLLRCTLTAVVLTVFLAQILERHTGLPAHSALAPIALAIGAMGNGWRGIFGALGSTLRAIAGRLGGGQ